MFYCKRSTRSLPAKIVLVLYAALVTNGAIAANTKLETIAVTPTAKSITVGQKQFFTAKGAFSNGSTQVLGPSIGNMALGYYDTCALLISGGVECWGYNFDGELGDGTTADSLIPRPVKGINTATAVAYSLFSRGHGCALLTGGAVRCWGTDYYGELGNGTNYFFVNFSVAVIGISNATAVAVGGENSCALLASSAVQCWGYNLYGQLGDGSNSDSNIPVSVTGVSTATALAVGGLHSCALLAGGSVQCWGNNLYGQLGDGSNTDSSVPVSVTGISTATALALGREHSCALLASGAVQCWGSSGAGQLGYGSRTNSSIPVAVTGISTAIAITAGDVHTCAVLRSGTAQCWGYNGFGQLGNGTTKSSIVPVRVHVISAPTRLAAGGTHTCALLSDGAMRCWGSDLKGQLGNRRETNLPIRLPVNVVGTPGVVWESSDPSKATISGRGLATGRAVGNTTITATSAALINNNALLTVQ